MHYSEVLGALVALSVLTQMFNFWCISEKKLKASYVLTIITGSLFVVVEGMLAMHDEAQRTLFAYVAMDLFMIYCGIKGLRKGNG